MSSADFNAFGEDKDGFKAHLYAWFFGPAYVPDNYDHLPNWQGIVLPPRYGPPSPQQVLWLPPGWKPNPPPLYYGSPSAPYLPKPRNFNPNLFDGLKRMGRKSFLQLSSVRHNSNAEVMDGGE